jgi:hypothetical protein
MARNSSSFSKLMPAIRAAAGIDRFKVGWNLEIFLSVGTISLFTYSHESNITSCSPCVVPYVSLLAKPIFVVD